LLGSSLPYLLVFVLPSITHPSPQHKKKEKAEKAEEKAEKKAALERKAARKQKD
jgi:hypothetical protein